MISDERVFHNVIEAFECHPGLQRSRLRIDVKSRIVTIRGRVQSIAQRQDAERIARRIVGTRALVLKVGVS